MIGPLTQRAQRDAELAYADVCADPYFNDGDDPFDNHWRASLAAISSAHTEAGELLLVAPDDAYHVAWVAEGIGREHRWEFAS